MHVATRVNFPILTSYFIFPNKEGLEILQKICAQEKTNEWPSFQFSKTSKKRMFKLCYHLNPKKNNLGGGLSSKENGES
jgi:hypothetical protein